MPPVDQNINQHIDQPDDIDITNDSTEFVDAGRVPPDPLPGVKLPKTKLQWEEANLFFSLNIDFTTPISDINVFAQNLQQTIYSYFATNYGTLKNGSTDTSKYKTMSVKELKRELANLKKNPLNGTEIKLVSHLIRARLEKKGVPDNLINRDISVKEISIDRRLSQNLRKTCNQIFETSEKILPTFHIDSCVSYFKNILHQINKRKRFVFPDWIHRLKEPLNPCSIEAPTYQEVARAVRKSKAKGSPCPLDMISVIVLKRCPILRTILHKLIVACLGNENYSIMLEERLHNTDIQEGRYK